MENTPKKTGPKRQEPREGQAALFIREFPVALRHRARMLALSRNITLREFIITAVTEKISTTA